MAGYQSILKPAPTAGKGQYVSLLGFKTTANPNADELKTKRAEEERRRKEQEAQRKQREADAQKAKQANSLLGKAKKIGKDVLESAKDTASKTGNTLAAGGVGVGGLAKASYQSVTGDTAGANKTVAETNKKAANLLNSGNRGKGGFMTAQQAQSGGDGAKGFKDNFIKPTSQAVNEIAQYTPVGKVAKGASLLRKVGIAAAENAVVGGGVAIANEAVQGNFNKSGVKNVLQSAAVGAAVGGAVPVVGAGGKAVKDAASSKAGITAAKDFTSKTQVQQAFKAADKHLPESHAEYFNVGKKTESIPMDKVVFRRPPESQQGRVDHAAQYMNDAAFGNADKRDPILAYQSSDGTYEILDGNSTTGVAKQQGWSSVPADIVKSVKAPTNAQVDATSRMIKAAKAEDPTFQADMGSVASTLGLEYKPGPVKGIARSLGKIVDDYDGDHTKLKDVIRGTMSLSDTSPQGLQTTLDAIEAKYPGTVVKNGYELRADGYRDIKVTVTTPGGHKGEIILATPEMLKAKNELGGHKLYETYRDPTQPLEVRQDAERKMNALYAAADASTNKRLASSSALPNSDTKNVAASSGDTSRASSAKPPTTVEAPEGNLVSRTVPSDSGTSTNTTSSSVIKKRGRELSSISTTIADDSKNVKQKSTTIKRNLLGSTKKPVTVTRDQTLDEAAQSSSNPEPNKVPTTNLKPSQTAHMEKIDGYTHSEDVIREYSDFLRQQELDRTGGQKVPDGAGGYKRISEHSKYYREFYKENGKAPTKADYREEAIRQLDAGTAGYGAGDTYKQLLEREAKPLPRTRPEGQVADTPKGQARVAKRIARGIKGEFGELAEYDTVTIQDQAEKAAALISDVDKLNRVISGTEKLPGNLRATALVTAIRSDPKLRLDDELLRRLANSPLASESSYSAQELRLARENAKLDPVNAFRNIKKARTQAYERKANKTATKAVSEEVKAIRTAKPKVTKETWSSFIEGLSC